MAVSWESLKVAKLEEVVAGKVEELETGEVEELVTGEESEFYIMIRNKAAAMRKEQMKSTEGWWMRCASCRKRGSLRWAACS